MGMSSRLKEWRHAQGTEYPPDRRECPAAAGAAQGQRREAVADGRGADDQTPQHHKCLYGEV